jgi:serine/threonine-protein kinase
MVSPFDRKRTGDEHAGTQFAFPSAALSGPVIRYAPGAVLSGKYRLDAVLGEGGMGAVWRGSHLGLELPIAIKLIRSDLDGSALRGRLQLEARSAAKLGHPAIVRVLDVGESELGDPFIVMELLQGETLAQLLDKQERLSGVHAVQLLLPIIDALAVAHARGIVHRDLKPENLMIASEDQRIQPKILDFGIAKLSDPRATDPSLTETGVVVGSPGYMSPEQARGRADVDHRTDIWSLCIVLYEAITGDVPFSESNYNALMRAIVEDEPKSIVEHASGDAQLWEILKRGLAKDRLDRYRSMAELGRTLAEWLVTRGITEDACGTSIEAKWLGRLRDPLPANDPSAADPPPVGGGFSPKRTPDGPAVTREAAAGRPLASPRWQTIHASTVRTLLIGSAVLGSLAFAIASSGKSRAIVASPARAEPVAHAASPPALGEPLTLTVVPQHEPLAPAAASAAASVPVKSPSERPANPSAAFQNPVSAGPRASTSSLASANGATPPAASAKRRNRELNLLSPY